MREVHLGAAGQETGRSGDLSSVPLKPSSAVTFCATIIPKRANSWRPAARSRRFLRLVPTTLADSGSSAANEELGHDTPLIRVGERHTLSRRVRSWMPLSGGVRLLARMEFVGRSGPACRRCCGEVPQRCGRVAPWAVDLHAQPERERLRASHILASWKSCAFADATAEFRRNLCATRLPTNHVHELLRSGWLETYQAYQAYQAVCNLAALHRAQESEPQVASRGGYRRRGRGPIGRCLGTIGVRAGKLTRASRCGTSEGSGVPTRFEPTSSHRSIVDHGQAPEQGQRLGTSPSV